MTLRWSQPSSPPRSPRRWSVRIQGVYDFQLDQFGIRKDDGETFSQALERVLKSDFLSHNDNAFLDLTIDKSLEINDASASSRTSTTSPTPATRPCRTRSPATTSRRPGCGRCSTPAHTTWANTMTSTRRRLLHRQELAPERRHGQHCLRLLPHPQRRHLPDARRQAGLDELRRYSNIHFKPGILNCSFAAATAYC